MFPPIKIIIVMAINLVVAIVRESLAKSIVSKLYENNIPGVSISPVRGYGEHVNVYSQELTDESVRLEVFVSERYAQHTADIIMQTARTGLEGDGIVAILPVGDMFQIRDHKKLTAADLTPTTPIV